jgi:Mrp family chromosome partitioning ATPase
MLRANIRMTRAGSNCRTLVVTSVHDGDGKSFVACNLAIAFAQARERVLLVDATLRKPVIHRAFAVSDEHGIMEALTSVEMAHMAEVGGIDGRIRLGQSRVPTPSVAPKVESPVHPGELGTTMGNQPIAGIVASGIPDLSVLVAGPRPSEATSMLGSEAAIRLMDRLAELWDIVIFDAAPLLSVADTRPLAAHADAVLVVARAGVTRRSDIQSCLGILEQAGRPLLGVALNDFVAGRLAWHPKQG